MRTRNTNNRSAKTMRKSLLAIVLMTLLTAGPVTAQIFLDDESLTYRDGWLGAMDEMGNIIPFHEVDWDQANYLPEPGLEGTCVLRRGRRCAGYSAQEGSVL